MIVVVPLTLPDGAVTVADPAATPLANPLLLIVAQLVLLEPHVTLLVRLVVLLSL